MSIYLWLGLIPLIAVSGLLVGLVVEWKRLFVVAIVGVCIPWLVIAIWVYFAAPTMTAHFAQRSAMVIAGIGYFVFFFREKEDSKADQIALLLQGVVWFVIISSFFLGGRYFAAFEQSRFDDLGEAQRKEVSQRLADEFVPIATKVSREAALEFGDSVLNEDESRFSSFRAGEFTLQKVAGANYWIAPLESRSFFEFEAAPGYLVVGADVDLAAGETPAVEFRQSWQDPDLAEATPVVLNYHLQGWFNRNIQRQLFNSGLQWYVREIVFEVDDNWRPWWVVLLIRPSAEYEPDVLDAILLVDPVTGEQQRFNPEAVPDWIDTRYSKRMSKEFVEQRQSYDAKKLHFLRDILRAP